MKKNSVVYPDIGFSSVSDADSFGGRDTDRGEKCEYPP